MKRILSALLLLPLLLAGEAHAATSFSANLCMPKPQQGDQASANSWGNLLNSGADIIDGASSAVASASVAGSSNVVLTFNCGSLDQTDAAHFIFTGALTGNIDVLWPNGRTRMFSVTNSTSGAFTLSLGVNNGSGLPAGTVQTIAQGSSALFYSNGTDVLSRIDIGVSNVTLQRFTATGTYTPTSGTKFSWVRMCGSGAGGYQQSSTTAGGGGGAGEYAEGVFSAAQIGVSQAVTIALGGAASANGSTTSLGSLLTAAGGSTGANSSPVGGAGGTGGTGTGAHIQGGDGSNASSMGASQILGGTGGASAFGGGGRGGTGILDNGQPGRAKCSGGGGNGVAASTWSNAGAGADGFMEMLEFR